MMPSQITPFHYAFKVKDLDSTRKFYIDILNCKEGRSTEHWVDFNFFGHQLSAHVIQNIPPLDYCGKVDGIEVPLPHFGCILSVDEFKNIESKLNQAAIEFIISPQLRYKNHPGEQWTMFFLDFSNNPIELKAFTNPEEIYSK